MKKILLLVFVCLFLFSVNAFGLTYAELQVQKAEYESKLRLDEVAELEAEMDRLKYSSAKEAIDRVEMIKLEINIILMKEMSYRADLRFKSGDKVGYYDFKIKQVQYHFNAVKSILEDQKKELDFISGSIDRRAIERSKELQKTIPQYEYMYQEDLLLIDEYTKLINVELQKIEIDNSLSKATVNLNINNSDSEPKLSLSWEKVQYAQKYEWKILNADIGGMVASGTVNSSDNVSVDLPDSDYNKFQDKASYRVMVFVNDKYKVAEQVFVFAKHNPIVTNPIVTNPIVTNPPVSDSEKDLTEPTIVKPTNPVVIEPKPKQNQTTKPKQNQTTKPKQNQLNIRVNGKIVNSIVPVVRNSEKSVQYKFVERFGFKTQYVSKNGTIIITKGKTIFRLFVNKTTVIANNKNQKMKNPVFIHNKVPMIPISFINNYLKVKVE